MAYFKTAIFAMFVCLLVTKILLPFEIHIFKLIANLGLFVYNRPATAEVPGIIKLMDAGMTMARFNMSHGN